MAVPGGKEGPFTFQAALVLAALFVTLNILDARLTSIAISVGSTELNPLSAGFGDSPLLKAAISTAVVIPLLIIRWWRAIALLCIGMSAVVAWNALSVLTWLP